MRNASRPFLSPGSRAARRPARGEEGAAAVEAAIVLPIVLLLLFGIVDFGRALQQQALLTSAAREGARTGALNGTSATVQTKVQGIAGTNATVASTLCTGTAIGSDSTVTVTQPFTPLTPIFAFMQIYGSGNSSFTTLKATGVMSCTG